MMAHNWQLDAVDDCAVDDGEFDARVEETTQVIGREGEGVLGQEREVGDGPFAQDAALAFREYCSGAAVGVGAQGCVEVDGLLGDPGPPPSRSARDSAV